jgi:tetratricopeptide (TPR) repeat protein
MDRPNATFALLDAAAAHDQAGRRGEARKLLDKALRAAPRDMDALQALAIRHLQEGETEKGLQLLRRARAYHPGEPAVHNNLGNALAFAGQPEAALACYDAALALSPDHAGAHANRGVALDDLGRSQEALEAFGRAIALKPDNAHALFSRAKLLQAQARPMSALADLDRALGLRPDVAEAWFQRGRMLLDVGRPDEALASFDQALALSPDMVLAHIGRAGALLVLKRFEEALASDERAVALAPDFAVAWSNRGMVLQELRRLDEAMASFGRAIALDPDLAEVRVNRAFCRLLQGDYERGFEEAEWRWRSAQGQAVDRGLAEPLWLGDQDVAGRTVFLYGDQGFGDTLQFLRYAPALAALGASVVLEVQPGLFRLLQGMPGVDQVIGKGAPLPPFDLQCSLASLPLAFRTRIETIPAAGGYVAIPQAQAERWAGILGPAQRPRIGVVWSGNPANKANVNRKVPQERLLAAMPEGVELVNLQVEMDDAEARRLDAAGVTRADHHIVDFADTAGLLAHLDLVVTVDTGVAHLAGALGRPAWVLLSYVPDWRWSLDRDDSPWYASLRLFRQDRPADWTGPLDRLRAELQEWAQSKG